jgi:PII-like signaling protein
MEVGMQGSQLTVFAATTGPRKHHQTTVGWILDEARQAGIQGATVVEVSECVDVHGKYHAARVDALLDRLRQGNVPLFYTRCAVEYEVLGSGVP